MESNYRLYGAPTVEERQIRYNREELAASRTA